MRFGTPVAGSGRCRPEAGEVRRLSSLDGLRAVAVVSVMLFHLQQPGWFLGGYVGVDIFFVLSGYLITAGLLAERGRKGRVDVVAFYARRALRLFPALAVVVVATAASVVFLAALRPVRAVTMGSIPSVVFYAANWHFAAMANMNFGPLAHTWSLSVEEQYYLLWPVVLICGLRTRTNPDRLAVWILALTVLEWATRYAFAAHGAPWEVTYYSTGFHSDGLLVGSALALLAANHRPAVARLLSRPAAAGAGVALGWLMAAGDNTFGIETPLWISVAVVASAVLVGHLVTHPDPLGARLLGRRGPVWIGRRSYGIYLWHFPLYMTLGFLARPGTHTKLTAELIGFALAFVAAAISYRYIEQPFLKIKVRYQRASIQDPEVTASAAPVALAGLSPKN